MIALIATTPASVAIDRSETILARAGTIWNGEAALAGGDRLSWRWAPLRSIAGLGFAVDWQVTGPQSDLAGRALVRGERVVLDAVSGRGSGALIEAAAPYLPFRCTLSFQADLARVAVGGGDAVAEGDARSDAGSCTLKSGGAATPVPPLVLAARPAGEDSLITITPAGEPARRLVTATLSAEGRLTLEVTPEGGAVLPFAVPPGSAGVKVETSL